MANFSHILRGTGMWNILNSYKVVKLNWREASVTAPLKNDNSIRHQGMQNIVGTCTQLWEQVWLAFAL